MQKYLKKKKKLLPWPLLSLSDRKGHAKIYIKVDLDAHTYDKSSQLLEYFGVCDCALVNMYIYIVSHKIK